jgi:DNA polymerase-3 subunit alpha
MSSRPVARGPGAPRLHACRRRRDLRPGPLTDHVPLYKGPNDEIVTQYTMGDVEKIGLVKFDFPRPQDPDDDSAGPKSLVNHRHVPTGRRCSVEQLPFDDP